MASPKLEKMQRISPLVPVNDEFYLRRKNWFDKSARKNIYRNCLLPVLSLLPNGLIEVPCYLFKMFDACCVTARGGSQTHGEKDFVKDRIQFIGR